MAMLEQKNKLNLDTQRLFEAETLALQLLIAGVNPNPQDDYSMNSPSSKLRGTKQSAELINQLIDCIKAI
jgi:hypothetical protein